MLKSFWEVIHTGIELHLDFGPDVADIEDREVPILAHTQWDSWTEKHPLWGSRNCPEPGEIEQEGYRVTELYIGKYQGKKDRVSERILNKRNAVTVGNEVYLLVADLDDLPILTDSDWEEIEQKVLNN